MALETRSRLIVLDPVVGPTDVKGKLAQRPESLEGKRVGFLWNHRQGGERILEGVKAELSQKYQLAGTLDRTKHYIGEPAPKEMLEELASTCDVVVTAIGD